MQKISISVFIITKNEEDRIALAIESVKSLADEILVVDSGSDDKTVEIAKKLGAKVLFRKWEGYGPQKVFAEKKCKNKWVLNIDADERLSDEVVSEIRELFLNEEQEEYCGYKIKILNQFFNEDKPNKWAYYYNQLRLYNKDFCGFKDSTVHDSVVLNNEGKKLPNQIGKLKNIIAHESFRSYGHWIEKINSYSDAQALDAFKKGKNVSGLKILLTVILSFLKGYFIRRYFIYGFRGFVYSYVFAFGRAMKMIKIRAVFEKNAK
jgi:glycosyltransferase involved in cell wall biosynthesis